VDNAEGSDLRVWGTLLGRGECRTHQQQGPMDLQRMTVVEVAAKLAGGEMTVYMLMSRAGCPQ